MILDDEILLLWEDEESEYIVFLKPKYITKLAGDHNSGLFSKQLYYCCFPNDRAPRLHSHSSDEDYHRPAFSVMHLEHVCPLVLASIRSHWESSTHYRQSRDLSQAQTEGYLPLQWIVCFWRIPLNLVRNLLSMVSTWYHLTLPARCTYLVDVSLGVLELCRSLQIVEYSLVFIFFKWMANASPVVPRISAIHRQCDEPVCRMFVGHSVSNE